MNSIRFQSGKQNHYEYLRAIHQGNDKAYLDEKNLRRDQYILPLNAIQ